MDKNKQVKKRKKIRKKDSLSRAYLTGRMKNKALNKSLDAVDFSKLR
jgi:hypothetical protein